MKTNDTLSIASLSTLRCHTHLTAERPQSMSEGIGLLRVDSENIRPEEGQHSFMISTLKIFNV